MLQNISSLKYFHGSNGELKQMGFQCDLSTHQTPLTQIIVQQSCSWIHITFWEKQQGYSEKGPAPRCYSSRRCLCAKVGAQCLERASAICCKCWERNSGMGETIAVVFHWEIKDGVKKSVKKGEVLQVKTHFSHIQDSKSRSCSFLVAAMRGWLLSQGGCRARAVCPPCSSPSHQELQPEHRAPGTAAPC